MRRTGKHRPRINCPTWPGCFVLALVCFFVESVLAGYTLRFKVRRPDQR